jgi:hypothetical protein
MDGCDFEELALKSDDLCHFWFESELSESEKAPLSVRTVPFRINCVR